MKFCVTNALVNTQNAKTYWQNKKGDLTLNVKIPKIIFGPIIAVLIAMLLSFVLSDTSIESLAPVDSRNLEFENIGKNSESEIFSKNLYSGPFAILDGTYGVDDTVFLIGSEIPVNSKGTIDFIRPDGKIHHSFPFDGSKSAVNHYFTPVSSSDLRECLDCEFFGTWTISFRSDEGISYSSINFEVIDE